MGAAGYAFVAPWSWGENIAWSGQTGSNPDVMATTAQLHRNLFVDSGIAGRGHRLNILNGSFREIGAGVQTGSFQGYRAVMATEDFGYSGNGAFLTGVAYSDTVQADNFYTPGEGLGGVTVTATPVSGGQAFSTTTFSTGGYSLRLNPGTYDVVASGGSVGTVRYSGVVIGSENVKKDFNPGAAAPVGPQATISASTVKLAGGRDYVFKVTYSDSQAIDVSDIGNGDVHVTGPKGFSQDAKFVSVNAKGDGTPRTATYRITAPGGYWNSSDNGTYTVAMKSGAVRSFSGTAVAAGTLGTFKASVPAGSLPAAVVSAPDLTRSRTWYTFTVTYSSANRIRVSDLDSNDILVTGPNGFNAKATFRSVNLTSNGTPRTATYRFSAPDGVWSSNESGEYVITMRANNARDMLGNYVPPKELGRFRVILA